MAHLSLRPKSKAYSPEGFKILVVTSCQRLEFIKSWFRV